MRIILATAAALFALAATPASAQFGGSPSEQVDGAPADPGMTAPQGDSDAVAYTPAPAEADYADAADEDDGAYRDAVDSPADIEAARAAAEDKLDAGADLASNEAGYEDGYIAPWQVGPNDADDGAYPAGDEAYSDDSDETEAPGEATWQGEAGQAYCRRSDGTTGLVVGGGAGALVGRGIDGGRRRGTGTIIGAIAGAIIGSAVERSASEQGCR